MSCNKKQRNSTKLIWFHTFVTLFGSLVQIFSIFGKLTFYLLIDLTELFVHLTNCLVSEDGVRFYPFIQNVIELTMRLIFHFYNDNVLVSAYRKLSPPPSRDVQALPRGQRSFKHLYFNHQGKSELAFIFIWME